MALLAYIKKIEENEPGKKLGGQHLLSILEEKKQIKGTIDTHQTNRNGNILKTIIQLYSQ